MTGIDPRARQTSTNQISPTIGLFSWEVIKDESFAKTSFGRFCQPWTRALWRFRGKPRGIYPAVVAKMPLQASIFANSNKLSNICEADQ